MIEIKNLHYSYGKITALRGINLAANSGEITAIIGANGAGKSTLMIALQVCSSQISVRSSAMGKDCRRSRTMWLSAILFWFQREDGFSQT